MRQSFLFALLVGVTLFPATRARSQQLLLAIEKTTLERAQDYLANDFYLYAILERDCLIGTSSGGTAVLSSGHIPYDVILRDMKPGACYLATVPPHVYGLDLSSLDNILYGNENLVVVEASRQQAEILRRSGFELVSLMPLAIKKKASIHRGDLVLRKRSSDGLIEKLVREVSSDSIESHVRALTGFMTRYSYADSCSSAGQWIHDKFQSFGVDASFHYYDWDGNNWRNVIGTIPGKSDSTVIAIICGHFDSISEDPWNLAPGAEDNGSGTATVIETARVLSKEDHEYTLRFICFSGEEQGLRGSYYYVTEAFLRGDNIIAAMNFDMVGYTDDFHYDLSARYDSNSIWLGNMMTAASRFSKLELYPSHYSSPSSDHWYFQQYGYPATFSVHISRAHGYPFYHSIYDTAGNLNPDFLAEVTKMGVASMAMLGNGYPEPPLPPEAVSATDAGARGEVQVDWTPSLTPGVLGYNVYYGLSPRRYEGSVFAGDTTSLCLSGLRNDTLHFFSVTAIDNNAEGGYSREATAVPRLVPRPPQSLSLIPTYLGMDLSWAPNTELDLAGYNVYRSENPGGPYQSVNPMLITDTTYSDSGLVSGQMYYYVATAVDTTDLESGYSEEKAGVPMSFDHGILLVDETRNGSTGILVPDSLQDRFYAQILSGYKFDSWDCDSSGLPAISTMGSYSTVIWRAEDIYDQYLSEQAEDLAYYLSQGGKLWLIGWKAIEGLMKQGEYPFTFILGDWPYDYLHLSSSENTAAVGLVTAEGEAGYPNLSVDSTKAPAPMNGSIYMIDTAVPRDAEAIFSFHSDGTDTTFDGEPIATRYLGSDFKAVFFGFPLYYMDEAEVRGVAEAVLDDLDEPKGIQERRLTEKARVRTVLFQNHPNPFTSSTRIRATLAGEFAKENIPVIRIYDTAGRLVRQLNFEESKGRTFATTWNGLANGGALLPSGTYFYRLSGSNTNQTKKLVLIH